MHMTVNLLIIIDCFFHPNACTESFPVSNFTAYCILKCGRTCFFPMSIVYILCYMVYILWYISYVQVYTTLAPLWTTVRPCTLFQFLTSMLHLRYFHALLMIALIMYICTNDYVHMYVMHICTNGYYNMT